MPEGQQYAVGTLCWVKHDREVWAPAEIVRANQDEIVAKITDLADDVNEDSAEIILRPRAAAAATPPPEQELYLRNMDEYSSEGLTVLDDLTQLTHLHEPAVLHSLQMRFDIDKIYTFTGPVLIAVNPFKYLPHVYDKNMLGQFLKAPKDPGIPHCYATARAAFLGIVERQASQSILVSGESGAGKTETTKFVMNQRPAPRSPAKEGHLEVALCMFAAACSAVESFCILLCLHISRYLAEAGAAGGEMSNVERQVLESNPLLEALGNACTLRNDNSSRFGKLIEMQFEPVKLADGTPHSRLAGARISTYLLEKIRVVDQQEGERNFHIFYQVCAAAVAAGANRQYEFTGAKLKKDKKPEPDTFDMSFFGPCSDFEYLRKSTKTTLEHADDLEDFEATMNAMQTIGISRTEQRGFLDVVAGVLHLGNVGFQAQANSEGSAVQNNADPNGPLHLAARALGVDPTSLEKSMCEKVIEARGERVQKANSVKVAVATRDALARGLYGLSFDRMRDRANEAIGFRPDLTSFIGVLDIFGFECFEHNSFEQLCINFTNEQLQQFFNTFVFKLEEKLYLSEGISWDPLDFPDNQDAVDLIQARPTGIFSMLDEECLVPGGSDIGFCNKLSKEQKENKRFGVNKLKQDVFIVNHFAGPVEYNCFDFLNKNRDTMSNDVVECMLDSSKQYVKTLFSTSPKFSKEPPAQTSSPQKPQGKKKVITVSNEFKTQLDDLMKIVKSTDPHFIRCIKPNGEQLPDIYDRSSVCEQLRYGGVLQAVKVSRAGYPVRSKHAESWLDYKVLAPKESIEKWQGLDAKARIVKLMEYLSPKLGLDATVHDRRVWAVGKTLTFFKHEAFEPLQSARLVLRTQSVTKIRATYKMYKQRIKYKITKMYILRMQACARGFIARCLYKKLQQEKFATVLQSVCRMLLARRQFLKQKNAAITIQAAHRGNKGRAAAKLHRQNTAATKLQSVWKGRASRLAWRDLSAAIVRAQGMWRIKTARRHLHRLKTEAKDAKEMLIKNQPMAQQASELRKPISTLELRVNQMELENSTLKDKLTKADIAKAAWFEERKGHLENIKELETRPLPTSEPTISEEKLAHYEAVELELEEQKQKNQVIEAELQQKTDELDASQRRYMQLLKTSSATSLAVHGSPSPSTTMNDGTGASPGRRESGKGIKVKRSIDIQLVGASGVGKTSLLADFVTNENPEQLERLNEQRSTLLAHHQLTCDGTPIKILDCSGNPRASHLVKGWFASALWVIVVYDLCEPSTLDVALELMENALKSGARCLLFGNKYRIEKGNEKLAVSVEKLAEAKDMAVRQGCIALENVAIIDAINMILSMGGDTINMDFKPPPRAEGSDGGSKGIMSGFMSMFGAGKS
eukprot:gene697-603_t